MYYPIKLKAEKKNIIWGGKRLASEFKKGEPGEKIAETWELSVRNDTCNTILNGEYRGKTMHEYLSENPSATGELAPKDRFPLLIKFIDAEADLSIQVHPDNEYALAHTEDIGKTEMWYIVDAAEGADIIYGLKDKFDGEAFSAALESGTVEKLMNYVPVKKGDVFFIPSGMVHAIKSGILIAEIQQNSDITYRVYDYNRRQPDGTLRRLHVEDALRVIKDYTPAELEKYRGEGEKLVSCEYFNVWKYSISGGKELLCEKKSFLSVLFTEGSGIIECGGVSCDFEKGDSFFLPAGAGKCVISGKCEAVVSSL